MRLTDDHQLPMLVSTVGSFCPRVFTPHRPHVGCAVALFGQDVYATYDPESEDGTAPRPPTARANPGPVRWGGGRFSLPRGCPFARGLIRQVDFVRS